MKSVLLVMSMLYLLSLMYIISSTMFLNYATTKSFFTTSFLPILFRLEKDVYTVNSCWLSKRGLIVDGVPSLLKKFIYFDYYRNIAIFEPILTIFWIGLLPCLIIFPFRLIYFIRAVFPGYWFLRLFRLSPFSINILLNWVQVMTPLPLLSAS